MMTMLMFVIFVIYMTITVLNMPLSWTFNIYIGCIIFIGEQWQKVILKDNYSGGKEAEPKAPVSGASSPDAMPNYRIDPRVMSVEHDNDDSIDEKVNSVLRVADDIKPAPRPPAPAAMVADPDTSSSLQNVASMADVYFLSKICMCVFMLF